MNRPVHFHSGAQGYQTKAVISAKNHGRRSFRCILADSVPVPNEDTHLLWQVDNGLMLRLAPEQQGEILATSCQHCLVGTDLPPLHQYCHITQDVLLPLFIQAQEDVGTMHRRLIHIHGSFRLLRRHSLLRA